MKDLRTFSPREMLLLWAGGVLVAVGLLVGAPRVARHAVHPLLNQMARRSLAYRDRDREEDSAWVVYARAHPRDSAAQAEAQRRSMTLAQSVKADSMMSAMVKRGTLDTAFNPDAGSERSAVTALTMLFATTVMIGTGFAIPLCLAAVTIWWGLPRWRQGRNEGRPDEPWGRT